MNRAIWATDRVLAERADDGIAGSAPVNRDCEIRQHSTVHKYKRGDLIFAEGESANFVYFVESGVVRVTRFIKNGNRQILAFRVRGDLFGVPGSNSAEAASDARVYRLRWQKLCQLMREDQRMQDAAMAKLLDYFRETQAHLTLLGQQNTYQRLASVLLDFVRRAEFFDPNNMMLSMPVNHVDVADFLAAPPQSTSRAFAKLEGDGLIRRINSRTIHIVDIAGLELMESGPRRRVPPQLC